MHRTQAGMLPLDRTWEWFAHLGEQQTYESGLRPLHNCSTIGTFWQVYNNLHLEAFLHNDVALNGTCIQAFSMFEEGCKPTWEDPLNQTGAEWVYKGLKQASRAYKIFNVLVLALVGNSGLGHDVVGVRLVKRTKLRTTTCYKVEIWMRACDPETTKLQICKLCRQEFSHPPILLQHQEQTMRAQRLLGASEPGREKKRATPTLPSGN